MTKPDWQKIEQLFYEVLERKPTDREIYLAAACQGDGELRREVEAMLVAHEGEARLSIEERWEERDTDPAESIDATDSIVGARVGAYRIERELGRGGMGNVYLAERDDKQFEQKVAIKLMRPGLHTPETVDRFRRERQILAQLEHPNIATLLDGGVTEDGRPFLAMQYVNGVNITDYCEANSLTLRERLSIFRTVCSAVHAAHVKLVVHRDLKPANILVTHTGEVKLLDFGIAKLLEPTDDFEATGPLHRVMTPEHAAPEQVRGEPVTTATDVYALGVLLYELLTGRRPLHVPSNASSDIERIICEVEPDAPSLVAADKHKRAIRGDLDKIVLTALRKEPARRYQSAQEFNADIGRHLDALPVHAERDTFGYRMRKFVARNRMGVGVAGVFVAIVGAFLVLTAQQARQVTKERDRAVKENAKAEQVVGVLVDLFQQSNPYVVPGGDTLRVSEFIEQSEKSILEMGDEPEVQAKLWEVLGAIHYARSGYPQARSFYQKALNYYETDPDEHAPDAARVQHWVAVVTNSEGGADAERLFRESLARHRTLFDPSHPDVASAIRDLAGVITQSKPKEAAKLLEEALTIDSRRPTTDDTGLAATHNALGMLYSSSGKSAQAETHFRDALRLLAKIVGPDHPYALAVKHNIASTQSERGKWTEAERTHRELLEARSRIYGEGSETVGNSISELAMTLTNQARYDEATDLFKEALGIFERVLGDDHWRVSNTSRNIGVLSNLDGRPSDALPYLDRAIAIDVRSGRDTTAASAIKRSARGAALYAMGRPSEGISQSQDALNDVDRLAPDGNTRYPARARMNLASLLLDQGNASESETLLRGALDMWANQYDPDHVRVAHAHTMLGAALAEQGRTKEAAELLSKNHTATLLWGQVSPLDRSLIKKALAQVGISTP